MCLGGTDVTEARARPGGGWASAVVAVPADEGTHVSLRMWRVVDGIEVEILSDPAPATGRGLSGGVHVWHPDGDAVFVVTKSAGIVRVDMEDDRPVRTTALPFGPDRSWSTPAVSGDGRTLAAVADWREVCSWELDDDPYVGAVAMVHSGPDFVIDCEWWGDGVMAVAWDRPAMPWTSSRIIGADLPHGTSVQQPRASADNTVCGWIDDSNGANNVHLQSGTGRSCTNDTHENGGPTWGPGQRSWCISPDGTKAAFARNVNGFGQLQILLNEDDRTVWRPVSLAVHGCLSWEGDTLVALRTGARTPTQVVAYKVSEESFVSGEHLRSVLFETGDPAWRSTYDDELVEPDILTTGSEGVTLTSRFYRAARPHGGVIVWVHGGPHDQWQVTWRPRFTYWLSRGWSILVPDHRGSSGHGRDFMRAQEGAWGGIDASDVLASTKEVWSRSPEGWMVPRRTVFMGGSAGGLTALNAARMAHVAGIDVGGVVVSYPVVDLDAMFDGDDPFETHDMERLIGLRGSPSVARRSPHLNAHELRGIPVLCFHGDLDTSVPLSHSQLLVEAVNAAGGIATLVVMEGEGHGFRDPANVRKEYATTATFLDDVFFAHSDGR